MIDRSGSERAELNRFLARHGFGHLSDHGLLAQLALCVEDEATLKRVLNLCAPEERTGAYEALRPCLRFTPRPLDVLLSELAMDAEARQLPIVTEGGGLRAFNAPELSDKLAEPFATGYMELNCHRCLKFEAIPAISRQVGAQVALDRGWTNTVGVTRCPACSELMGLNHAAFRAAAAEGHE